MRLKENLKMTKMFTIVLVELDFSRNSKQSNTAKENRSREERDKAEEKEKDKR